MSKDKQIEKININKFQRRRNSKIKTLLRDTTRNKNKKEAFKYAKRMFSKANSETKLELFKKYISKLSKLRKFGIINLAKMKRVQSKITLKFNQLK